MDWDFEPGRANKEYEDWGKERAMERERERKTNNKVVRLRDCNTKSINRANIDIDIDI